jgi:hypothetical protein
MAMPVLKSLTFTAVPKPTNDPVLIRRAKLVAKLEEQRALFQNPSYARTVQRSVTENGQKKRVEKQQRVRPWWRCDPAGNLVFSIYSGTKPVEFEKGKAGIAVPSKEKFPALIDTLVAAAKSGELDDILKNASKPPFPKARKAA